MGLFSFFRKDKQKRDSAGESAYVSRSASDTVRQRSQRNTSKNEAKSPDVPENRRARRRLVGAVVLVLAVIIILPRIFDSEPNPHQDIALQIPDQAKDTHSIDVPANPSQPSQSAPVQNSTGVTVDNDTEEEVMSSAPTQPVTPAPSAPVDMTPPVMPAPAQEAPAAAPSAPVKPAAPAVTAPAAKAPEVVAKPAPKPVPAKPKETKDDNAESARALAILEGRTPPKAAAADKSSNSSDAKKYVVQVAALSDPVKVEALRQRLSSAGISSFTQKINTASGETTRIRVGPFNGKDAAETMRAKINRLGLNASVMPV